VRYRGYSGYGYSVDTAIADGVFLGVRRYSRGGYLGLSSLLQHDVRCIWGFWNLGLPHLPTRAAECGMGYTLQYQTPYFSAVYTYVISIFFQARTSSPQSIFITTATST
jgi:hypothetical protein